MKWICENIDWIAPTLSLIILTIILIIIAVKQNKIQKQNVKIALFNERYILYSKIIDFVQKVYSQKTFSDNDVFQYNRNIEAAQFLFNKEILNYINLIRAKALEFKRLNCLYDMRIEQNENCDVSNIVEEKAEIYNWFFFQVQGELSEMFSNYIDIKKIGLK